MTILIKNLITTFMEERINDDIYNEFSFQHELGIYFRENLPGYKVQFERNISSFCKNVKTIKKEIDIVITNEDKSEKYAIELKYPKNGQYPEQMYSFVKDIKFMEELKELNFTNCYCITMVNDEKFYTGNYKPNDIYSHFRFNNPLKNTIYKPTGKYKNTMFIELNNEYVVNWIDVNKNYKYYLISM